MIPKNKGLNNSFMKKYWFFLVFSLSPILIFSQKINTDVFGDLQYHSSRGNYKSSLEKNIFNDLIFSDNRGNKITLEYKYIKLKHPELLKNKGRKLNLFIDMIYTHRKDENYRATYSIDVLNEIVFEDNRNIKIEQGEDIFGNQFYKEHTNNVHSSIEKNLTGDWEYNSNTENATLKKDIFNVWKYNDSKGNKIEFNDTAWENLKKRFGKEIAIFQYLINNFLKNDLF